jgi:hypothetical protein
VPLTFFIQPPQTKYIINATMPSALTSILERGLSDKSSSQGSKSFSKIPQKAKTHPSPFTLSIPEAQLSEFRTLVRLSKLGPDTWESRQEDRRFGVTLSWLADARKYWMEEFDW